MKLTMYRRLTHYSLLLSMICMLSACGFQLRGVGNSATALPEEWKSMNLDTGNPNSEFSRDVIAIFSANGVQWTDRENANYRLVLGPETFKQRTLSLNSEARVAEYELTLNANFSVLDADNKEVMPSTSLTVIKQMENDPRNVVGKAGEAQLIQAEMLSELSNKIMRRIGFHAASTQPQISPNPNPSSNSNSSVQ
jgi:LPS-assembly lipoprotein